MGYRFLFSLLLCGVIFMLSACDTERPYVVSQTATPLHLPPSSTMLVAQAENPVDYIVVQKKDKIISLWKKGRIIKTYPILAFGADPLGHKVREGDEKTPEGAYTIDTKHVSQNFQKFLRISYPNEKDRANAARLGVPAGGQVGIHGDKGGIAGFFQRFDKSWTDGCVAIRNADIEEVYKMIAVGTPIMIKP